MSTIAHILLPRLMGFIGLYCFNEFLQLNKIMLSLMLICSLTLYNIIKLLLRVSNKRSYFIKLVSIVSRHCLIVIQCNLVKTCWNRFLNNALETSGVLKSCIIICHRRNWTMFLICVQICFKQDSLSNSHIF